MLKVHQDLKNRLSWVSVMEEMTVPQNPFIVDKETARLQHLVIQKWIVKELLSLYRQQKPTSLIPLFKNLDEITCRKQIEAFVDISMSRTFCHPIVFPIGAFYLSKIISNHVLKKTNLTELLLRYSVCVTLASKMYEDKYVGNQIYFSWFYNIDAPVTLKSFSELEFKMLDVMNYDLYIGYEDLKTFMVSCK
jgi:hypothetical protein